MAELKKNQKTMLYVGIGAVVLYLLYRYYENNNASSAASTPASDAATGDSADYAALAGQEQSDVAGLQAQNQQLQGQEQSDVSGIDQILQGIEAQITALQAAASATPVVGAVVPPPNPAKHRDKAPKLAKGGIRAPYGSRKPEAKMGYRVKGQGRGFWEYVPAKAHNTHKVNAPKKHAANVSHKVAPPPKAHVKNPTTKHKRGRR